MKNRVKKSLSLFLAVIMLLCAVPFTELTGITMKASAAVNLTSAQIKNYVESRVGQTYSSNSCLAFVRECFMNLGGPRSTACCAYKYGNSFIKSTSKDNIPIGADVFFGNKNVTCSTCGNYCGHIGIYVGNGYMVHASGGKILKSKLTYVSNYRGWGYHGGINIVNGDSSSESLIAPSISFQKPSYSIGEQVTFSWTASPSSVLSHYWVIVDLPGGIPWISTRIDKSVTSYSFTANKEGSYYVYVAATPYGSSSGEGSLECKKYIEVTNLKIPTIQFNKAHYSIGEQVTFSWTASPSSVLSHYWVIVDLPGGIPWISTRIDKSVTSYSFTANKEGSYYVYVAATPYGSSSGEGSLECRKYIEIISPNGNHNYSSKVTTAATCTSTGIITYTCTQCSASYTETIAKNPSNHVGGTAVKNVKAATCTAKGYTGDTYCLGCGVITIKGTEIPAKGHGDSNNDGKCDTCGVAFGEPEKPDTPNTPDAPSGNCNHICHKKGIAHFFYLIARLFWKIFNTNKYCSCGTPHY